jgi:hypothetical protein
MQCKRISDSGKSVNSRRNSRLITAIWDELANCRRGRRRNYHNTRVSAFGPLINVNYISILIGPSLSFLKNNLAKILVVFLSAAALFLVYWITSYSLRKLKPEIFSYYPFDKFFPKSGSWSVIYFIITIILLGAIAFLMVRGGFYMGPA